MFGVGLGQLADVATRLEKRHLRVDARQCVKARHKNATCARCIDRCPFHAIAWDGSLEVDWDKCQDCGICASACPTDALVAASPTNAELLRRVEERKGTACLIFACAKVGGQADERVLQVDCLGRLDESILVSAAACGIEQILLVDGACQNCAINAGRAVSADVVAESNGLLAAFGLPPRIEFMAQLPNTPGAAKIPQGDALSRRAFFTKLTRDTQAVAALTVSGILEAPNDQPGDGAKREAPQQVPARRRHLLDALKRVGHVKEPQFETRRGAWGTCQIRVNCTGCEMCARFCPTGALSKSEQEGKPALDFRASICTGCRLCQDICFWNAVAVSGKVDLNKALADTPDSLVFASETVALHSTEAKLKRLTNSMR